MLRLQYLTLMVIISFLATNNINLAPAHATNNTTRSKSSIIAQKSPESEDEMLDALQKRQEKLENLKELKQLQDLLDKEQQDAATLDKLKALNINLESVEQLNDLQEIINNQDLEDSEIIATLRQQNIDINTTEQLQQIKKIVNQGNIVANESDKLSATMAFRMFTIGIPAGIIILLVGTRFSKTIVKVITGNYQQKFGKPPIPERSLNLHHNALKNAISLGRKAEKIDDDKFGNDEFKTLIEFQINVAKNEVGFKDLNYKVELLRAAIVAQKSFLQLEATELRYRSRKQQVFYQYIADNLDEELDKEDFAKKIKKKQAEILPLINTEEGRNAIHSYAKEINDISKHELGLKLLALFKKHDLKDFSIIRDISQVVEGLQGYELLEPKRLVVTVKEYYDLFEKIAPILDINKQESSAATYARILQIVGLFYRHGDAYQQFRELIRLLHKWKQPYETITTIREQFSPREYTIPKEFEQAIPGISTHEKYAKYLETFA